MVMAATGVSFTAVMLMVAESPVDRVAARPVLPPSSMCKVSFAFADGVSVLSL